MKALLMAAVLCAAAVVATPARAEPPPTPSPPGIGFAGKRPPAEAPRWGDGKTSRGPQPIAEPAKGSAYNLTHIVYASIIMLAMLALTIWLVRRHSRR